MPGHTCHHCKQWVETGEAHDCWTTTEAALTRDLSDDLQDAYERLRETVVEFGEQRIYASHKSIMFSRKACYLFVRPKKSALEVVFFLGRALRAPHVRKVVSASQVKRAHIVHVRHRDEVEAPITDWLREAYEVSDRLSGRTVRKAARKAAGTKRAAKTGIPGKKHGRKKI
ncbi:MAG TPA: DUF5655 domain-containing protein [Vicinamibacterales bacterium]|nr:DUF5655 domain-containing protein [Vicinamibacterales bacterium]